VVLAAGLDVRLRLVFGLSWAWGNGMGTAQLQRMGDVMLCQVGLAWCALTLPGD